MENKFNKVCYYIDGWNLPADCKLELGQVVLNTDMVSQGSQAQYRLKPAEGYEPQVYNHIYFFCFTEGSCSRGLYAMTTKVTCEIKKNPETSRIVKVIFDDECQRQNIASKFV